MKDNEKTVVLNLVPNADTRHPEKKLDLDINVDKVIRPVEDFFPRIRTDLLVSQGKGDTVVVRIPSASVSFPIYKLEWQIAQLMDGSRSLSDISMEMSTRGLPTKPELILSFVRELKGYGFLAPDSEANLNQGATHPSFKKPVSLSEEEQQLLGTALRLHERGDNHSACNYLMAILEVNPNNHQVRSLLRTYQSEPTNLSPTEKTADEPFILETELMSANEPESVPTQRAKKSIFFRFFLVLLLICATTVAVVYILYGKNLFNSSGPQDKNIPTVSTDNLRFLLPLEPIEKTTVSSPAAGTLQDFSVTLGTKVKAESVLANVVDKKLNLRIMQTTKEYNLLKKRAKRNPSLMDFALDAKRRLESLKSRARPQSIKAPLGGTVSRIFLKNGQIVEPGQSLLELQQDSVLQVILPATIGDRITVQSECQLVDIALRSKTPPCRLKESSPAHWVATFDNASGTLAAGQIVEIEVSKKK